MGFLHMLPSLCSIYIYVRQFCPIKYSIIFKKDEKYIVMGVDFVVIWAADFINATRFLRRRLVCWSRVTRRLPSHQYLKEMKNRSLWVSILWQLISLMPPYFTLPPRPPVKGHPPPTVTPIFKRDASYIVMGVDFWVIGTSDFNSVIRFYVRR